MISTEYILVKWKDGDYEEIEITIQENAVEDFCEMMEWDEEDFANNTVRRPIEVEEEEDPINSRQTIKPIKIDPKKLPKKMHEIIAEKDPHKKRKRRTKAEMISDGEQVKEKGVRKPRTNLLFSEEVDKLIKENYEDYRDVDLVEKIKEELGQTFTYEQIKAHRKQIGCMKSRGGQTTREKKKVGKPKKYTDEVVEFLKDNINNFSNKELSNELESQFNLKVSPGILAGTLSQKGIKRDEVFPTGFNKEITDFVMESTKTDAYVLRDDIIEKFEKDVGISKLREIMKKRNLSGESVSDEVKRIKQQREPEDDDMDFLEEE